MRLTAYKEALQEAAKLPTEIPEFRRYFKNDYNPRREAIDFILTVAREDKQFSYYNLYELIRLADDIIIC